MGLPTTWSRHGELRHGSKRDGQPWTRNPQPQPIPFVHRAVKSNATRSAVRIDPREAEREEPSRSYSRRAVRSPHQVQADIIGAILWRPVKRTTSIHQEHLPLPRLDEPVASSHLTDVTASDMECTSMNRNILPRSKDARRKTTGLQDCNSGDSFFAAEMFLCRREPMGTGKSWRRPWSVCGV